MQDTSLIQNLVFQLAVMLTAGGLFCWAAEKLKMSRVVGGILAGILIGPALLAVLPQQHTDLFHSTTQEQMQLAGAEAHLETLSTTLQEDIAALKAIDVTKEYRLSEEKRAQAILEDKRAETVTPIQNKIDLKKSRRKDGRLLILILASVVVLFCSGGNAKLSMATEPSLAALLAVAASAAACLGLAAMFDSISWVAAAGAAVGCWAGSLPIEKPVADQLRSDSTSATTAVSFATGFGLVGGLVLIAAGTETQSMGFVATLGIGLTAVATLICLKLGRPKQTMILPAAAAVLIAALAGPAWAVWAAALCGLLLVADKQSEPLRWMGRLAEPLVLVYAGMRLEPAMVGNWWIPILLIVIFGDVRACGVVAAMRWRQTDWSRSLIVATAFVRGGTVTAVIALGLLESKLIGAEIYAGLILGCFATALLAAPVMTAIARCYKSDEVSGDTSATTSD